jgi:hypothetical protein
MNFCGFSQISEAKWHFSSKFSSEPHRIQDYDNIIAVGEHSPHQHTKTIPSQLGVTCISVWKALNSEGGIPITLNPFTIPYSKD